MIKISKLTYYTTLFSQKIHSEKYYQKNKLTQLRISESEKFPHVTYFFNGLKQEPFLGEERIKIDSPKVATYDLKPEMSAKEVCSKVIKQIKQNKHDFILLNFANSDMVGHTGNFKAVIKAMSQVDKYIGQIKTQIDKTDGLLMITSDHGNCETMKDETGEPHTKHTYNQVPFILCNKAYALNQDYTNLSLYNIAPTILEIMNIKNPKENAQSLIISKNQ